MFGTFAGFNFVVFDIRWIQLCLKVSLDSTLLFLIFAGFNCPEDQSRLKRKV